MKKFFVSLIILALSGSALAQAITPPKSLIMQNQGNVKNNSQNLNNQNAELQGYSIAFLAYHYNDYCKLGIDRSVIDLLAGELKKAESTNQISTEVINENVAETKRLFNEDPVKFCNDAKQIATVLQGMFFGGGN